MPAELHWAGVRERRRPLVLVVATLDLLAAGGFFAGDTTEVFGRYAGAALIAVPLLVAALSLGFARGEQLGWKLGTGLGMATWAAMLMGLASMSARVQASPSRPNSVDPLLGMAMLAGLGLLALPALGAFAAHGFLVVGASSGRRGALVAAAVGLVLVGGTWLSPVRSWVGCWRRFAVDCGVRPPLGEVRLPIVACVERPDCLARVKAHHAARRLARLRVLLGDDCDERHARSCALLADAEVELASPERHADALRRSAELLARACELEPGTCRFSSVPFAPP